MNVKKVIKQRGFTIKRVAERLKLHYGSLLNMLSGNMTIQTLQRIADVIGCNVGDFFADEIEMPEPPQKCCPHCGKPLDIEIKPIEK